MLYSLILAGRCPAVDQEFACNYLFFCVYGFVICVYPLGGLGAHFALLGATLGLLLGAVGSQGALLGVTLGSLWLPWDAGGPPWATLGYQV